MSASLLAVVVDCAEPGRQAGFWSQVLSYEVVERNTEEFLVRDPAGLAAPLYFMKVPEPRTQKNRLHLDVVTDGPLTDEVDRLTGLGARLVEFRQDPDTLANPDTWAVLEDPEGLVFCASSSSTLTGWD
ncbi:VOC family protein [Nocardioides panacis]|uniref:VOC family protein n=2 Tax=Nocardioides panacis TaxID=2849501 RepID=A0A975SYP7_9ACTN|nr:VOC family protein [Nocardioides panacis]QWZ08321.1 VOC family protein [Nocardioides panacis]